MKKINKVLPPLVYDEVEGNFSFSPVEFLAREQRGRDEEKERKREREKKRGRMFDILFE